MTINRVGPLSVGKIAAFLYGIIGLFIGALIAVFALFGIAGVAAIVIAPLVYAFMGFIGAVIMALVYNVVARVVGGIQVDVS